MLETSALQPLRGCQFKLSTQLIKPNYPVILPHRRSTTVSLETYPLHQLRLAITTGCYYECLFHY